MGRVDPTVSRVPRYATDFLLDVDSAQTSCGFSVPNYQYPKDRSDLVDWTEKIGEEGVKNYWREKNQTSIDGKPTKIFD